MQCYRTTPAALPTIVIDHQHFWNNVHPNNRHYQFDSKSTTTTTIWFLGQFELNAFYAAVLSACIIRESVSILIFPQIYWRSKPMMGVIIRLWSYYYTATQFSGVPIYVYVPLPLSRRRFNPPPPPRGLLLPISWELFIGREVWRCWEAGSRRSNLKS